MNWEPWTPPYDPRLVDGAIVTEDEHHRLIETADCGTRCPGCGICCAGYRDVITEDYFGVEEFEPNLRMGRGGLIERDAGLWYRPATCDTSCPGYGRCCPPFEEREHPQTVADARHILLEREDSQRWEMQESLLILAHDGSDEAVDILEAYLPRAHTRMEGFAELALEEGRYFASVPRNAEEAREMMQREVLREWENRAARAWGEIHEKLEPELEKLRYEAEVMQRLLDKAEDETTREDWQIQLDVHQMFVGQTEGEIEEQQQELSLCEQMIDEIRADLGEASPFETEVGDNDE